MTLGSALAILSAVSARLCERPVRRSASVLNSSRPATRWASWHSARPARRSDAPYQRTDTPAPARTITPVNAAAT
ncbi:hypothetical protein G6F40_017870 [Rhizopus arrhizus]|nr:hypothetical protein G6F40_017870 [Rhizopus arrhizus]